MDKSTEITKTVSPKDVAMKMQIDYSRGVKDQLTKDLEAICIMCRKLERPDLNVEEFATEAADVIMRQFSIESVAIGLRDQLDKLYKYAVVVGLDEEVQKGFKNLAYTREQLLALSTYPSYDIGEHTKLFLAEDHPYADGEEFTYRRPGLIGMKRRSLTDSLEADYLDFFFNGPDGEILGFIEISGTRMKKLPDVTTIRWIELIAAILGAGLQKRGWAAKPRI